MFSLWEELLSGCFQLRRAEVRSALACTAVLWVGAPHQHFLRGPVAIADCIRIPGRMWDQSG